MKTKISKALAALSATTIMATGAPAWAATNTASDPGGGGVTLTSSGAVTVTSSALQLVKQVYDASGNCLASMPSDGTCTASSVNVPAGTSLKFLIFVRNATDVALTDVRFRDVLDITPVTGFSYSAGSIKRTPNDGTAPAEGATGATVYADATTAQLDTVGAPDDYASYVTGTLTVGAVAGQANQSLSVPAHRSFGIMFSVTKN